MNNKYFIGILVVIMCFALVGCTVTVSDTNSNSSTENVAESQSSE